MNQVVFFLLSISLLSSSVVGTSFSLNDNLPATSSGANLFTGTSSSFNLNEDYNFIHIAFELLGEDQDLVITNVSFRLFKLPFKFANFNPEGKEFLEIHRILTPTFQTLEETINYKFKANDSIGYSVFAHPIEEIDRETANEKGLIVGYQIKFLRSLADLNPEPTNVNYNLIWLNLSLVLVGVIRTCKVRNKR